MGLFGRRKEQPLFGGLPSASEATIQVAEHVETELEDNEEEAVDPEWEAAVVEYQGKTVADLARDAAEDIVNGDTSETEEEATMYYTRAGAVGQLAVVRALQESGQITLQS